MVSPCFSSFYYLFYGFLMYLVVEIVRRRRGFDCNTPGWGVAYGFIFFIHLFRDFSWFGFSYVILTTAMVLLPLFVLRTNQSEDGPR